MSWDAGAIVSTLKLNLNEFGEGMLQAENIMSVFPQTVTEFLENPLLAFVEIAKEAGEKIYDTLKDAIVETARDAEDAWLQAQRQGVGVQWFSELTEAAKQVNVPVESVGTAITYMNRSMVMALQGEKDQIQGFQSLGISTDFLKSHLNDTQGMFEALFSHMAAIPSAAEKARIAFELLGRGGADMMPLFQMGSRGMDDAIQTAHRLGAVIDDTEVGSARAFQRTSVEFDEMWTGLKKQLSTPILEFLERHSEDVRRIVLELAHVLSSVLPYALDALLVPIAAVNQAFGDLITMATGFAAISDRLGITHGAAASIAPMAAESERLREAIVGLSQAGHELGGSIGQTAGEGGAAPNQSFHTHVAAQVSVPFDPRATADQVARRIAPMMMDLHRRAQKDLAAQAARAAVARSTGGRR